MTALRETSVAAPGPEPTLEAVSWAPILITEQEVMFGTSATLSRQPTTTHWWVGAASMLQAAMHRIHAISVPNAHPVHHAYPKHYAFLESACLAREMDRL